jgi:hypothetical protein
MAESWRGFERPSLLARARLVLEEQGASPETLDLLDDMENWDAHSLYQWLYENDADFESEARHKLLSAPR